MAMLLTQTFLNFYPECRYVQCRHAECHCAALAYYLYFKLCHIYLTLMRLYYICLLL